MAIHQVLISTDFSATSLLAAKLGSKLAKQLHAHIGFVHVIESLRHLHGSTKVLQDLQHELMANSNVSLASIMSDLDVGADATTQIRRGDVGLGILSSAAELRAELIVMGSVGSHGEEPYLLGSVAARIVRDAQCPVLVVRNTHTVDGIDGLFRKPTVAIDYSRFSVPCVNVASDLSRPDACIDLCNVLFQPVFELEPHSKFREANHEELEKLQAESLKNETIRLSEFAREQQVPQKLSSCVETGRAATGILEHAKKNGSDLIVTGAHGPESGAGLSLGTVADNVLRRSPVPVLIVPEGAIEVG